jgi:hypothetical protein
MMRWLPAVALGLVALGSLLLSAAVLVIPSSTFAQEEEGEVDQTIGGGGGGGGGGGAVLCSGRVRCDRGIPNGNMGPCCAMFLGNCRGMSYPYCLNNQGQSDPCGNPNPGFDANGVPLNCTGCTCKNVSRDSVICECAP